MICTSECWMLLSDWSWKPQRAIISLLQPIFVLRQQLLHNVVTSAKGDQSASVIMLCNFAQRALI